MRPLATSLLAGGEWSAPAKGPGVRLGPSGVPSDHRIPPQYLGPEGRDEMAT
ncbi:uncharacterized protein BDZ83DRAFT_615108 [Colletotrichum acutatum]|uniref:Uncharacterized protein n=1 Tax=Glomerella acutata TaxID=27357 RepID=A0AAD8ULU8_GLOAC|nr:uncharacterized protein BDZ83DRAFT_615108 [Colletotrichum acutatum]KAK1726677.1 hypothetical protein BDZ83DRAFT_615108 [Colletotrichum acutatum]